MAHDFDAVVVGSGPNGLSAAIALALCGLSVCVLEEKETIGGGARTAELTLPGFHHDVCSAIHPTGAISPFFRSLQLENWGLQWIESPAALAHPLDDGSAAVLAKSLSQTTDSLAEDKQAYEKMMRPFVENSDKLFDDLLRPLRMPEHPLFMARFGLLGLRSAKSLGNSRFRGPLARALFSGCAAHSNVSLKKAGTASFGLVLMLAAHAVGWPMVRGGSQSLISALALCLKSLGGQIRTNHAVKNLRDVPSSRVVLFDVTPRQLLQIAGDALPGGYKRALKRFHYGPAVFKIDWALSEPIPWRAASCGTAATVHIGGSADEIVASEEAAWRGKESDAPFIIVAQQSLFDATRAPAGKHTGWAYCHVPRGSVRDMTPILEAQVERFAPGFRDTILERHTLNPEKLQEHNANMIGGDLGGGTNNLKQVMIRPVLKWNPYSTPNPGLFLCSSSTPPGAGVHGMCGFHAARAVIQKLGIRLPDP